jgi:hypothetical protein
MPKITNPYVLDVLRNPYFDHHAVMHLSRERFRVPDGEPETLFLPEFATNHSHSPEPATGHSHSPEPATNDSHSMIETGQPGSGLEFLQMHHEMVRVFRFLLEHHDPPVPLFASWAGGRWGAGNAKPDPNWYYPLLWDLDDFDKLPHEIVGMFNVTDPDFLKSVFDGVKSRIANANCNRLTEPNGAIDDLGRFIERGVDLSSDPPQRPNGSGFHNTLHEYLAAREGWAAQGAEMNQLRNSMYNDYFWSLHLWIDGQYGRLLEKCGKPFNTTGLDPARTDLATHPGKHDTHPGMPAQMTGMSMA